MALWFFPLTVEHPELRQGLEFHLHLSGIVDSVDYQLDQLAR
jgi:hypothetical protein